MKRWKMYGIGGGHMNFDHTDPFSKRIWLCLPAAAERSLGLKRGQQNYVDIALDARKRLIISKAKQPSKRSKRKT